MSISSAQGKNNVGVAYGNLNIVILKDEGSVDDGEFRGHAIESLLSMFRYGWMMDGWFGHHTLAVTESNQEGENHLAADPGLPISGIQWRCSPSSAKIQLPPLLYYKMLVFQRVQFAKRIHSVISICIFT